MFSSETDRAWDRQLGRLDYGVFVTFSSSNRGGTHWVRVRGVSRHGDLGRPHDWSWDTCAIPLSLLKEILSVLETTLIEEVEHRYGIQDELPM